MDGLHIVIVSLAVCLGYLFISARERRYRAALQEIKFRSSWMKPGKFGDAYRIACRALNTRPYQEIWEAKSAKKKAARANATHNESISVITKEGR